MKYNIVVSGLYEENNALDELLLYKIVKGLFNNYELVFTKVKYFIQEGQFAGFYTSDVIQLF